MKIRSFWLKTLGIVALIWALAIAGMYLARSRQPTAADVIAMVNKAPLDSTDSAARQAYLDALADKMNHLTFDERQKVWAEGGLNPAFDRMTPDENARFFDRCFSSSLKQFVEVLNRMSPGERQHIVREALDRVAEIKAGTGETDGSTVRLDDAHTKKYMKEGFQSFLSDSSAQTKMDFAPVLEQAQVLVQDVNLMNEIQGK